MPDPPVSPLLLEALFDDASLFPPASLPMDRAVAGHLRHQAAWYAPMCGPFVCPDTRLGELAAALRAGTAGPGKIALSVIVTGGPGALPAAVAAAAADPRLDLRAVEIPVRGGGPAEDFAARVAAGLPRGAAGHVEVPVAAVTPGLLQSLAGRGLRAKLRTGGTTAAAFPSEAELAAVICALAAAPLPFKCTAGLHHAVRHTEAGTGFEQHGFLNVLLAVHAAVAGGDRDAVAAVLARRDAGRVAAEISRLDDEQAAAARGLLTSIGTCSTEEPVADLAALGLARPASTERAAG
jgi:hypothetical protein